VLFFKRIAYLVWSRRKKRVTVEEFLRWQERAYPAGADSASATLFRERPILIDVIHAVCHQGLRQPASIAGQSPLAVIHSCLVGDCSDQHSPSEEAVYGDIRRLESSHPAAFRWLFGAALAYTGRGWRE
jgi:hypothetical protein